MRGPPYPVAAEVHALRCGVACPEVSRGERPRRQGGDPVGEQDQAGRAKSHLALLARRVADSAAWSMRTLLSIGRVIASCPPRMALIAAPRMRRVRLPIMPPARWCRYFACASRVPASWRCSRRVASSAATSWAQQRVGAAGEGEVVLEVAGGLGDGHAGHVVADGDALVEGYLEPSLSRPRLTRTSAAWT